MMEERSSKQAGPNCPFDVLVIIDFEATCDEPDTGVPLVNSNTSEIIEFPWITIDPCTLEIINEEQQYVKPQVCIHYPCGLVKM